LRSLELLDLRLEGLDLLLKRLQIGGGDRGALRMDRSCHE
jgi:hypothetical protein